MYNILLGLHNVLRWIILLLLVVTIIQIAVGNAKIALSKWLFIFTNITFLIGLYLYFAGGNGYAYIQQYGMSEVMKNDTYRFWAVEHIAGMIVSVAFISVGYSALKKGQRKKANMFLVLALIMILAVVPWPFREAVGRPLIPHFG
jgi:hypothetical protein